MKKIVLQEQHRDTIMDIDIARRDKNFPEYKYITNEVLNGVFDWFLRHRLTVQENAATWHYISGKKETMCYGYSGPSINARDTEKEMVENLAHEIFCRTEWLARIVKKENQYEYAAKAYFGRDFKSLANLC